MAARLPPSRDSAILSSRACDLKSGRVCPIDGEEAFTDLDDIHSYIAKDSLDAADRVITEIFDAIRALIPFPHQGHKRPDLTLRPLLFVLLVNI